jgi:hypothetical protein
MTISSIKSDLHSIDGRLEGLAISDPTSGDLNTLAFAVHKLVHCIEDLADEVARLG